MNVLETLGYLNSPKFIQPSGLSKLPPSELAFALRKYQNSQDSSLTGTYVIQKESKESAVPIIYTFKVDSEETAKRIHKLVWNQNLAPFLLIQSPSTIRIYPSFSYSTSDDNPIISVAINSTNLLQQLSAFSAEAIDDGSIWQHYGHLVDPTKRVDEKLLKDLKLLDEHLQNHNMSRVTSHGIIGKYLYLHYLRARDILSNRKLEKWHLTEKDIFGRDASFSAFQQLDKELQKWLNGSVFSLADSSLSKLSEKQLQLVSSVFNGDSPNGQLSLDFQIYDFSYIPIETLSCVYEQFLHDTAGKDGKSRGEKLSAYYTPIPLTDYIISELETRRPLKEGMKILDPSCGSGSFLVQCYRRLIEKKYHSSKKQLTPPELRELLVKHIFGIDKDQDACRVTELSLILTLLDYVNPPDLENTTFKLPTLRENNIFEADFFDSNSKWQKIMGNVRFDWVVGNPPWDEVTGKPSVKKHEHYFVWRWIVENKKTFPISGNQIAECFLWKVAQHCNDNSVVGLLIPAMTWFKREAQMFREHFFSQRQVWCLANFANMAFVLFGGRITPRASAVFFKCIQPNVDNTIISFAPFVVEQIANRSSQKRIPTWNIIVNGNEIKDVSIQQATTGEQLPWKVAMWGSNRDTKLLQKIKNKFKRFDQFVDEVGINQPREGIQLRQSANSQKDEVEKHKELIGKKKIIINKFKNVDNIFSFPSQTISKIGEQEVYVRKRGGLSGLEVSKPPHILIDAARRFAIFSEEFILVPPRQIGISGTTKHIKLLRAISLYLSSYFCKYHQFMNSPQFGIGHDIADLKTLKLLPVPFDLLTDHELNEWSNIQKDLADLSQKQYNGMGFSTADEERFASLIKEMNAKVFKMLQLRPSEIILIEDFVNIHFELMSGKVTTSVTRKPTSQEMIEYLTTLRNNLDVFLPENQSIHHKIEMFHNHDSAIFSVSLAREKESIPVRILSGNTDEAKSLKTMRDILRHKHSQWVYFDRGLKVYENGTFHQFKPLQRLHWSRRQAILDADEIIAETLGEGNPS